MKPVFEVIEFRKDDDSYFYSNTDYSYRIICKNTGDELYSFYGSVSAGRGYDHKDGVSSIHINDAASEALIFYYDGKQERIELPVKVTLSKDRKNIVLTFKDGKSEIRERNPVMHVTKFGDVIVYPLIKPPDKTGND